MTSDIASIDPGGSAHSGPDSGGAAIRDTTRVADRLLVALLGAAAFALYAALGLRLAQGAYLDYYNLAFDFDPVRYVATFALSPADPGGVKHPLILLLRPLALPFLALGFDPKQASVLVMAAFGAGTVCLCFLFLRVVRAGRPEAAALTVLFAVTSTPVFNAIIVEAYGPAEFGLAALWLLTASRLADGRERLWSRQAIAVFCFGVTVTNVMQVFVAELLVSSRRVGPWEALRRAILFGLVLSAILAVLCLVVWHDTVAAILADPVLALKQVYWLRTKGERTGVAQVLQTFFGYSFVSPAYDIVPLPEGIGMLDFRRWRFSAIGTAAVSSWLAFFVSGAVGALAHPRTRWLAAGLATTLLLNVLFHLDFQFRGSLYIYAAHTHFLVFALAAGLTPWLQGRAGWIYAGLVLALAVLVAADNLPIVEAFTRSFDTVTINCPAPCTETDH